MVISCLVYNCITCFLTRIGHIQGLFQPCHLYIGARNESTVEWILILIVGNALQLNVVAITANRQLSDVNRDGALSLDEFCTAMHLVVLRRNDIELPDTLPPVLQPYTPLVTSGTCIFSFCWKVYMKLKCNVRHACCTYIILAAISR